jgi:hypothetical protein
MTTATGRYRRHGALLACAALTLAVVSACGDDDKDQPSSTEAWAGKVCAAGSNWLDAVTDAQASLTDTSNLSVDSLRGAFDDVAGATETLVTDLGKVGKPDTDAGDQARAQVSTLSDQLEEQRTVISNAADQAGSVQGLLAQVSTVTQAIGTMFSDIGTTIDNLRGLEGSDELQKAFQDASACQELRASAGASPSA